MSRTTHPGARAALLLLALLGLLAMHGLSAHGAAGHHGAEPTGSTAAGHGAGHHVDQPQQAVAVVTDVLTPATPLAPPASDEAATSAGLCLAVLLLGLIGLLALRRDRPLLRPDRTAVVASTRAPPARDPDPPDLSRLCVLRC
ncbi:hypothetical protein ASG49_08825 [Marmoricola sp. Leaf446]|uniref:DUF6153 family protein n=1 Tax=Marmoricola sp. Leaf446 TaxID=1736379 RepID=UPI0006F73E1E|nr:DUF6153 family protein [Marmoricola sp. Leaf446]KQT92068.1 hypothetical protein ASG49_08825 [Marmoricola sp. Leaf446]